MLRETPNAKTGPKTKQLGSDAELNSIPTLADLGIGKKISMIAQRLADLSQAQFEQVRDGTATITQVLRAIKRATTTNFTWSLDCVEQRLRAVINCAIDNAPPGSPLLIGELLCDLAKELADAGQAELREAIAIARDELSVRDSEPGGLRFFEVDASTVIGGCPSTYPPWFKVLTTRKPGVTPLTRGQVEARLDDMEAGKLPTKRTTRTHTAVYMAIENLPRTSSLCRGVKCATTT